MKLITVVFVFLMFTGISCSQQTAENLSREGLSFYSNGEYDQALAAFDEVIQIDSDYPQVWVNKGNVLYKMGNHADAIKSYNKAIERGAHLEYLFCKNGDALREQGNFSAAIKYYDAAIKQDTNNTGAWHARGLALGGLNKNSEAISSFKKANSSILDLGKYYLEKDRYDLARLCFDEVIKHDSDNSIAWYSRGIALEGLGKYDESIKSYKKADSFDGVYLGNQHLDVGEYSIAIIYYNEVIKEDSKDAYAWYNKAVALRMLHRDSEAKTAYTKAREFGYDGPMTLLEATL